ncbi:FecCD family ABC transporter permease [Streptomyces bambusae]|uniref:Iron chelate uptake ABC transporter family permease subunit n=1 Tax=Streptomyces bambusae TaxID=1550616 RepID=A0ABS6Z373_9ACTN|nr:iron ABC transporter permease [Streptomyces bambusae]MBW5482213.1 iron chelate uptake ABC transporter family permease subunit [Streptomyces bambusae]
MTLKPAVAGATGSTGSTGSTGTTPRRTPPIRPAPRRTATRAAVAVALLAAVLAAVCASFAIGTKSVPLSDVLSAIAGSSEGDAVVIRELRMPRTAIGLIVGLALGAAGAVAQDITRNPLGDPGLIGISAGGSFAVALGIGMFGLTSPYQYIWFAFLGAALAGLLAYAVGGTGYGGATPAKLALAGAAVTVLLDAGTNTLVLLDVRTLDQYRFWAVGSLAGRDSGLAWDLLPFAVAGLVLAVGLSGRLNALALGDDLATSLGTKVRTTRALGAVAVILLAGTAVAAAGPVTFVGLVVPHVVRAFTGPDARWLVPCSALGGAALMLTADVVGRMVARPGELEAGVVTALLGAPFLALLVKRGKLKEHTR